MADISTFDLLIIPYAEEDPDQFMRLHLPRELPTSNIPVVVIIHGGFWKNVWTVSNAAHTTLAPSLVDSGAYAAVEVEYRRRDSPGGGYPGTMDDIELCLQQLAVFVQKHTLPLDLERLILLGHSAGGQLALLYADSASKASAESGVRPLPIPKLVIAIAPVVDLVAAYERKLSDEGDAAERFMKCKPSDEDGKCLERYMDASPRHRCIPLRLPTLLVTGKGDTDVPFDMVLAFSDAATAAAASNPEFTNDISILLCNDKTDHYGPVNAESTEWAKIRAAMDAAVASWA